MNNNDLGRNISVFLKLPDLERIKRLKEEGITMTEIFKRGIDELEQDCIKDVTQNNNS